MRYFLRVAQPVPMSTKEGADSGRAHKRDDTIHKPNEKSIYYVQN